MTFDPDKTQEFIIPDAEPEPKPLEGDPELNAIIDSVAQKTQQMESLVGRAFTAKVDGKEVTIILERVEPGSIIGEIDTGASRGRKITLPIDLRTLGLLK